MGSHSSRQTNSKNNNIPTNATDERKPSRETHALYVVSSSNSYSSIFIMCVCVCVCVRESLYEFMYRGRVLSGAVGRHWGQQHLSQSGSEG